ncbi:alpha-2-macroglobulin family protein [Pseudorhodoplanes sp.]|uniref:alpha-2-macroglobulin family protein n=1 Tax=Pseudorhodoplanes sp. TaxID=1934341 RepID=UPI003918D2CB
MFALTRADLFAALLGFVCALSVSDIRPALAQTQNAERPFSRADLDEAAVRLEAQIKADAGQVTKPVVQLRREMDEAFKKNDFRTGLQLLGQIVSVEPDDATSWLRLARSVAQIRPANARERTLLLERSATAGYIAYERSDNPAEQAEALQIIGNSFAERRVWRPALDALRNALELREVAAIRAQYEQLREEHGFRLLDYTVDADAASPRACFQFSETLPGRRTDFSPFVAVSGIDRPAITAAEKQLCVEGLKHGKRYTVTLRAGLPSTAEPLARAADFTVYIRDRRPQVRFTGRSYVLPRTGQQGIPLVSVNSKVAKVDIYRVGDRNLIVTVLGSDFQRALSRYDAEQLRDERGQQVWTGELALEYSLNNEVTTAFPIDQALGELKPGVYVMVAAPKDADPGDEFSSLATQWFIVSDLGLAAFSGHDGIHASVHSLASTAPVAGLEVRLLSRSNEVLAIRRSDVNGQVRFERDLTRGEGGLSPALIVAAADADYAFLNLKAPAFDLSDRGVAGRKAPEGLDAFVYTERGVYRTGETVHITALLRNAASVAQTGVPLTIVVERPDGVEYRRIVTKDDGLGGRSLSLPIAPTASTGTWRVKAFADPKRPAIGEAAFLVEDYVPDRLEFDIAAPAGKISPDAPAEITLNGRFLYGAPAANLVIEGEILVSAAKERPGFPGYRFGTEEPLEAEQQPLDELGTTDEDGKASFAVPLDAVPTTERLLEARIAIRLAESGGRAVERKLTLPVTPSADMVGVRPLFNGRSLGERDNAGFDVIMVDSEGRRIAKNGLRYELSRIETRYQWYRQHGYWNFEPVKSSRRIADGAIDVSAEGAPARLSLPVTWGRYRLDVTDSDGAITQVSFDAGFYAEAGSDTPDLLEIALDKPEYRAGDTMTVAVTARSDGRVTLNVVGDRMLATVSAEAKTGLNRIEIPVGKDWGNGAYVVATLRRPLDTAAKRMPGRAVGVQWFAVDKASRALGMEMTLPQVMRPNGALRVPVKLSGLGRGEDARIVVAAVDVGILNLTNYQPPAPGDYFLGQRRLAAEMRDLYGQLIDGMQGSRGAIRTGGDNGGPAMEGSPPAQKPLALYSGIVQVKADGTAEVSFDIPAFAGTIRVMAVGWSAGRVGHASGDVIVRDPVVVTATLPRFLNTGDKSTLHLDIDNVEGAAGDYAVTVAAQVPAGGGSKQAQTVALRVKERRSLSFPLAVTAAGAAIISVNVDGPGGFTLARDYTLNVRPANQFMTRRTVRQIAKGESITLSDDLVADLVPGTGNVAISVGPSTALDAAAILKALDRYPFGCTEQIASRALPLLYVNDLAAASQLALDTDADQRIRDLIDRILARQGSNGSFGLWSVGGDDPWLDAYVTDFLTRARERGFAVPDAAFRLALERLRNNIAIAPEPSKDGGRELAYALYVLARNGTAPVGDLRYIADTKLNAIATPIAKAQIAAALGLLGDKARADRVYQAALDAIAPQPKLEFGRQDYGSALRDSAALVTLASESNAPRQTVSAAISRVEAARQLSAYTSTQENAWLVLAARAIARDAAGVVMTVNGSAHRGAFYRSADAAQLRATPLRIGNGGEETLQAVVSVTGAPLVAEPAAENGFKIERNYFTLNGTPVDIAQAKQNERYAVVLKITEGQPQFGRILVADYLPAGFEIDNPRLVSSGDTGTLSWIELAKTPEHAEFRDDRFTAAFNRNAKDPAIFTVAYVVLAVAPGSYAHPQAFVEDMYRPDRFGRTATGKVEVTAAR